MATTAGPAAVIVTGGPHTIVGPGEDCLLCEDPLEPGDTYLFVSQDGVPGVAHDSCRAGTAETPVWPPPAGCDLVVDRMARRVGAASANPTPIA